MIRERRAWLFAGAAGLMVLAQLSLGRSNGWLGLGLYVLAALLFGAGVAPMPRAQAHRSSSGWDSWPTEAKQAIVAAALLIAMIAGLTNTENLSGMVWFLQACTLGVILLGSHLADSHLADRGTRSELALPSSQIDITTATTQVVLVLLVAAGAWMRFRNLGSTPFGFWFDEADVGLLARRITDEGYRPVFAGNVPAYDAYLIAILSTVFGEGIATVRAVSAIFGTATILAGYLVGRELFGKMGGLVLAALIAFSRWALTLSRIGMNNVTLPLFALLTLGFLLRGHRRQSNVDFALAGAAAGAGMLFYSAIASSVIAFGVFAMYLAITSRQDRRSLGPQVLVAALAAVTVMTPLLKFIVQDSERYFSRNRNTALWSDAGLQESDGVVDALRTSLSRYLPMTHYQGDRNGRHNLPGEPMVAPLVAAFSTAGAGLVLLRRDRWLVVLIALWVPLAFAPGVLSLPWEAPNSLRAVGVQPVVFVAATAAIVALAHSLVSSERTKQIALGVLTLALAVTSVSEMRDYFDGNSDRTDVWAAHSTPETIATQMGAAAPESTYVQVVSYLSDGPTQRYLAPDSPPDAIFASESPLPLWAPEGHDALIFATRESYPIAEQAVGLYPNATLQSEFHGQRSALIAIKIPAADIAASWGWTVDAGQPDTHRGVLMIEHDGQYQFRPTGADASAVRIVIDGVVLHACDAQNALPLAAGVHSIEVRGSRASPMIEWIAPAGGGWAPLPTDRVAQASYLPGGLVTTHYAGLESPDTPAFFEVDASLNLRMHEFVLERPFQTRWTGGLIVPAAGDYEFSLITDDQVEFKIDGKRVLTNGTEYAQQSAVVTLDEGTLPLSLLYKDQDGRSEVRVQWRPAGGQTPLVPIPQRSLVPWLQTSDLSSCA